VTIKARNPLTQLLAAGGPGREGLGALGTPGAGAGRGLRSSTGTQAGNAGQAGKGVHSFGPGGAWRGGTGG